ncbi:hypothetical protein NVP2275O_462 [Vibrio phage 2.275.O._10N.286.54.E11]|nr:hypothetical protein NVP2275O_462 [Vibrio phage 2.275.O._10N.286.54.E11]
MSLTFNHVEVTISTTSDKKPITLNNTGGVRFPRVDDSVLIEDGTIAIGSTEPAGRLHYKNNGTIRASSVHTDINIIKNEIDTLITDRFATITSRIVAEEQKDNIPKGVIAAWWSSYVPAGWATCNGQTVNGIKTPDLRDRFVPCVESLSTNGRNLGSSPTMNNLRINDYGGEATHKLTTSEIPDHKHVIPWGEAYSDPRAYPWGRYTNSRNSYGSKAGQDYDNRWRYTSPSGGDQPHNNLPKLYSLMFIMFVG